MEKSILKSTKKVLGISDSYTAFDLDVIMYVNNAFTTLYQLGVGAENFQIEDETATWNDFLPDGNLINQVKTFVYLSCKLLFDPPQTSYLLKSTEEQLREHEWRLRTMMEDAV